MGRSHQLLEVYIQLIHRLTLLNRLYLNIDGCLLHSLLVPVSGQQFYIDAFNLLIIVNCLS